MPRPEGQSCDNCYYYFDDPTLPVPRAGSCHFDKPGSWGASGGAWPPVYKDDWCGMWRAFGGSALSETDAGIGLRGSSDTGESVNATPTWQQITPAWAAVTSGVNMELVSPGVVRLNIPGAPAEMVVAMNIFGIVTFHSTSNNEEIRVAYGQNNAVLPESTVRRGFRTQDAIGPIPVGGVLSMKNQDTASLWVMSPTTVSAVAHDYHFWLWSTTVLTYG